MFANFFREDFNREPYEYNKYLRKQRGFNNPAFVDLMTKKLKLNIIPKFSLMKGLYE